MKDKLIINLIKNEEAMHITQIFTKENIDIRFVGGCLRNIFIGIQSYDIDFAIKCRPEDTVKVLQKHNISFEDYGKKYGLIVANISNKKFEITSLREDFNQRGRDTEVKFTNDWQKDALRRDFTFNALYLSPSGQLYDYFNGQNDLANLQIRFIGDIKHRIQEDYIRIFRFYRFLGCFKSLKILHDYENVLHKYIPKINIYLSNQVMRIEILKMLKNPYKINSFRDFHNPRLKNNLLKKINEWWIEDNYVLGIEKCMNKVDKCFI